MLHFRVRKSFSTLYKACKEALNENNLANKTKLFQSLPQNYLSGVLNKLYDEEDLPLDKNSSFAFPENLKFGIRDELPKFLKEHNIPMKIALIHGVAHIEYNAMNMYVDTIRCFIDEPAITQEFIQDILQTAKEESEHFEMLRHRLIDLGYDYGSLLVHDMLSKHSKKSQYSLVERIASYLRITTLFHEARGIDSGPRLLLKLRSYGDKKTEESLNIILKDEERHVSIGIKWFKYFCKQSKISPKTKFKETIKKYGLQIHPPLNHEGRERADFPREWYDETNEEKGAS